jgi:hypothetical protein
MQMQLLMMCCQYFKRFDNNEVWKRKGIRDDEKMKREECGVKEDVVTKIEKNMLRWFGHVEKMDERKLTKEIYEADVGGNVGRGRPKRTFLDQVGEVLEKGQVRSTRNRRACMRNLKTVEEAKDL